MLQTSRLSETEMVQPPFSDSAVEEKFTTYPQEVRERLLYLRRLIFDVHAHTPGCGELVETLKWGQPAYLTQKPKSGSTLRIDASGPEGLDVSLYFICTTSLVNNFRDMYDDQLTLIDNRELKLVEGCDFPEEVLRHCIALTLTYNLNSKQL